MGKIKRSSRSEPVTAVKVSSAFEIGEKVEVSDPERWTLFPATVVGLTSDPYELTVEFKSFDQQLRKKKVHIDLLKPSPPSHANPSSFDFGDNVDALLDGGWCHGLVIEALDSHSFRVCVRFSQQLLLFPPSRLRLHREWINGGWVPCPLTSTTQNEAIHKDAELDKARAIDEFCEGALIEVRIHEDGFQGAWFAATIVKAAEQGKKYIVKYHKLRRDDDKDFLTEAAVDERRIRPSPPEAIILDGFDIHDEVDAYYNDGWWEGVILKVLCGGRYRVFFEGTKDDCIFQHSELRTHQNWVDGAWSTAPRA